MPSTCLRVKWPLVWDRLASGTLPELWWEGGCPQTSGLIPLFALVQHFWVKKRNMLRSSPKGSSKYTDLWYVYTCCFQDGRSRWVYQQPGSRRDRNTVQRSYSPSNSLPWVLGAGWLQQHRARLSRICCACFVMYRFGFVLNQTVHHMSLHLNSVSPV